MRELELKAVVPDWDACVARLERAGARRLMRGTLLDVRFDAPTRTLFARDEVLRLRSFIGDDGSSWAELTWKGPTSIHEGLKSRDEITTSIGDPDAARTIIAQLGLVPITSTARRIDMLELNDATLRLERYEQMDDLLEVEGDAESIARAIEATGIPRAAFNTDRLDDFSRRYEARTGRSAETSVLRD